MWKPLKKLPKSLFGEDEKINPKYQVDKVYSNGQRCRMDAVISKEFFKKEEQKKDINYVFEYREKPKKKKLKS